MKPLETLTTAASGAAVTSPLWVHEVSGWAAEMLPILGALWLATQIGTTLYKTWKGKQ